MSNGFYIGSGWLAVAALLINAGLACIPAKMASKKGYGFAGHWCISFCVSFLIGIIFAASLPTKKSENNNEPPATKPSFFNTYLGFVIMAVLLIYTLVTGFLTPRFFSTEYVLITLRQLVPYGCVAVAVALTTRAKGPDLSLGAIMTLSGMITAVVFASGCSMAASIAAGLAAALVAGALSGALTVFLKLPSVLSSSLVLIVLTAATRLISHGRAVTVPHFQELTRAALLPAAIVVLSLVVVSAFLFVYFSRLGKPMHTRTGKQNCNGVSFAAYIAGALLAGFAGIYALARVGAAVPGGSNINIVYIWFIFGSMLSSRMLDNRLAPVPYAFGAALLYVTMGNVMALLSVASYWQVVITGLFTIILIMAGVFANRAAIKNMLAFK